MITEKFLAKSTEYLKLCDLAAELNKPMYVVIKDGANWDEFKQFPWRLPPLFFENEEEFDEAIRKIRLDLDFIDKVGGA